MSVTRGTFFASLMLTGILVAGCATIINGTSQEVSVASTPVGARVTLDGQAFGVTPVVTKLKRKTTHTLRLELEGFQPHELTFSQGVSGWVAGNILFGGLIGLVVDAVTGSMYKLKPDQVQAVLAAPVTTVSADGNALVVAVVLDADPAWEPIGKLELQVEQGRAWR
ncbi:MAG: PEGA domain-containing protein [Gemmatimonadales bacterium]